MSTLSDFLAILLSRRTGASLSERLLFINDLLRTPGRVKCTHKHAEILPLIRDLVEMPESIPGCIVEAGCFKGGGSVKLSLAARLCRRRLFVFDSFEGIPENTESTLKFAFDRQREDVMRLDPKDWPANLIIRDDGTISFAKGMYCGAYEEVRGNIEKWGSLANTTLVKGFFCDSLQGFSEPIAGVFLDVDLASSTRECLKAFYPLLVPGGVIYSHDGDLSDVLAVFESADFWRRELGVEPPEIHGAHRRKLLKIVKPTLPRAAAAGGTLAESKSY